MEPAATLRRNRLQTPKNPPEVREPAQCVLVKRDVSRAKRKRAKIEKFSTHGRDHVTGPLRALKRQLNSARRQNCTECTCMCTTALRSSFGAPSRRTFCPKTPEFAYLLHFLLLMHTTLTQCARRRRRHFSEGPAPKLPKDPTTEVGEKACRRRRSDFSRCEIPFFFPIIFPCSIRT